MIKKYSRFLFFILLIFCFSQGRAQVTHDVSVFGGELNFKDTWRYHEGDNKEWAKGSFDDRAWDAISISKWAHEDNDKLNGIVWFRQRLKVPPALFHKTMILQVEQSGASEIYLDGELVKSFGTVGDLKTEIPYDPQNSINYIQFGADSVQLVAVRFSSAKIKQKAFSIAFIQLNLVDVDEANKVVKANSAGEFFVTTLFAIFLTISIFHLLLYLYYRKVKSNLYYSLLAFLISLFWLYPILITLSHNPLAHATINQAISYIYAPCFFLIVLLLYSIFEHKWCWQFWVILGLTIVAEITLSFGFQYFITAIITQAIWASMRGISIVIRAVRAKKPGAWIIASGFLIFLSIIVCILLYASISFFLTNHANLGLNGRFANVMLIIWAFSIPTSMSVYLASDSARTNKRLALELIHVKQLSEQNIEKEREKQQIIEGQKQELEQKVKEATHEIMEQKDQLAEKNKEITDSINYARRIQTSILPEDDLMKSALGEHMVIYRPKDVVSGDFYWCHSLGDKTIFAVADCTGHGVPGAFMSMIGNSLLNEIVIGKLVMEANTILDELRKKLVETLQQNAQHITTRDGMDIALCVWDRKDNVLQFAGANNSLYLVSWDIAVNGSIKESERVRLSNQHLLEILPDKQPIGYQEDKMDNPFTKSIIQLHKGDTIYIASDGYTDQFGGERNKKFTSKKYRELIASLVNKPISQQHQILEETMDNWRKLEAQTDDICVIGVRI